MMAASPDKLTPKETKNQPNFYSSIPYATIPHLPYQDNASHEDYLDDKAPSDLGDTNLNRLTAIITLVLLAAVAVILGLMLAWGLSTLNSMSSPLNGENSILEL